MFRRLFILLLLSILAGCSSHGEPSQLSIIIHPDREGSKFDSVRWSPDGEWISYIRDGDLWVTNPTTKSNNKISSNKLIFTSAWVDHSHILYYASGSYKSGGAIVLKGDLWMVNITSKEATLLLKKIDPIDSISVIQKTAYLGGGKKGVRKLSIDEPTIQSEWLDINLNTGTKFSISPNGQKMAFLNWIDDENKASGRKSVLSLYDIEKGEIDQVERLKNYKIYNYCWSPDGKYIAFAGQSQDDKVPNLYVINIDRNGQPVLLEPSMNAADLDWSPTRNQLILEKVGQPGQNDIRIIDIQLRSLQ